MSNKQWYKDTFDSMVMSGEAIEKIKGIMEKKRMRTGFRVAAAIASLAVVFLLGNVAVYAATGSTLVEKGMERISVFIDKKEADVKEVKQYKDKEGNSVYEARTPDGETEGSVSWNEANMKEEHMSGIMEVDDGKLTVTLLSGELEKRGKSIYLVIGEGEKEVDITKDLEDGDAKGSFELDGKKYKYHVSGTAKKYDADIALKE